MRPGRGLGLAVLLGLGLALTGPASAETALSVEDMRALAFQEMQEGRYQASLDLTDVLLARDPEDVAALIVRAQALRGLGRLAEAEAAARKAFALAKSPSLLYGASLAMAQVMAHENHWTWAQIWLRRAQHYATTEEQRERVARDYRYVRTQNPLTLQFDFTIQPSDNVNNGSLHSVWSYFGIPLQLSGDAQALSGLIVGAGVAGSYVISQSQMSRDAILFSASANQVVLSPQARDQAPTATNEQFSRQGFSLGYEHKALLSPQGLIGTTTLTGSHQWYGGAPLANIANLQLAATAPLARQVQGFGTIGLTYNDRLDDPDLSSTLLSFTGGWGQLLRNGDGIRIEAGAVRTLSDDISTANGALSLGLDWNHAEPVAGILWSAGIAGLKSDWAIYPFSDTASGPGRHDLQLVAEVSALLTQISIYGYSPVISLSYVTNSSNIALYDSRTLGVGLSIRSRF